MSFRPYFIEGGTALEKGLQTAAEALGTGVVERANQTTFQNALNQLNLPPNTSEALSRLANTPGGRTEAVKIAGELIQRGGGLGLQFGQPAPPAQVTDKVSIDEKGNVVTEDVSTKIQYDPAVTENLFQGLKSSERVKRQESFRKENNPIILENNETNRGLKKRASDLKQMKQLNDSGKLTSGFGRLFNLRDDGSIRFTDLASVEDENYIKLVADQIKGAKDAIGARPTVFSLDSFLKTWPSLSNTNEGRDLINQVISVKTQLEKLRSDALANVYNEYGAQNIDPATAQKIANQSTKAEEDALYEQLENIYPAFQRQQEIIKFREKIPKGRILVQLTDQSGNKTLYQPLEKDFDELKAESESKGQILERL